MLAIACLAVLAAAAERSSDPLLPAQAYLARQDTTAAIDWLVRSHRTSDDPSGYILLGQLYRERGTIVGRLRSQKVLEEARRRFPHDDDVLVALGQTYYAQGFFPDAMNCLNAVLRRHPGRCDARYLVGLYHYNNWKRVNDFRDNLSIARRELRAAANCDTSNADAAFKYLVACYALGEPPASECARMVRRFPGHGEFLLFRGTLAFDEGRYEECRRDYEHGISLLDPETRRAYGSVRRVMTGTEQMRLESADADSLARAYWVRHDLDPTTAVNERELEHIRRMFLCDALYSPARYARPGWDQRVRGWETDRGEAFLKYGKPASVYYSLGDDSSSGRIEVWTYVINGVLQQILFVDEYLNGNPRIPYTADVVLHFLRESPRRTGFANTAIPIPGVLDVVTFREDALTASVYLSLRVDADSVRAATNGRSAELFNLRTAWFDDSWQRRGATADVIPADALAVRRDDARSSFEIVRRTSAAFDRLNFACAFEDEFAQARALLVGETDASRFIGDGLAMSDILLTAESGPDETVIVRHGRQIWPKIDHTYEAGEMLGVYVEIYNLARMAHQTEYDVRFAIYPGFDDDSSMWARWGRRIMAGIGFGGQPAVAQTFHRAGSTFDEHEDVRIDNSRLPAGAYELLVEVTDRRSGQQAAAHTAFQKREASVAGRE